jgi:hypothetical protein
MLMSDGYLANGKTILCRSSEADRYQSLADLDKPEVRVMVNPGGLNEKFATKISPMPPSSSIRRTRRFQIGWPKAMPT